MMAQEEPVFRQPMHQPVFDRRAPEKEMPCARHEQRIALTEQAVMSIKQTNEGLTTKMDILIGTMTKVALLEEKHGNQQQDVTRAHTKIETLTKTVDDLAQESRAFMNHTKGQNKVLWAIGGTVMALVIKALFFASSHGMTP